LEKITGKIVGKFCYNKKLIPGRTSFLHLH